MKFGPIDHLIIWCAETVVQDPVIFGLIPYRMRTPYLVRPLGILPQAVVNTLDQIPLAFFPFLPRVAFFDNFTQWF